MILEWWLLFCGTQWQKRTTPSLAYKSLANTNKSLPSERILLTTVRVIVLFALTHSCIYFLICIFVLVYSIVNLMLGALPASVKRKKYGSIDNVHIHTTVMSRNKGWKWWIYPLRLSLLSREWGEKSYIVSNTSNPPPFRHFSPHEEPHRRQLHHSFTSRVHRETIRRAVMDNYSFREIVHTFRITGSPSVGWPSPPLALFLTRVIWSPTAPIHRLPQSRRGPGIISQFWEPSKNWIN